MGRRADAVGDSGDANLLRSTARVAGAQAYADRLEVRLYRAPDGLVGHSAKTGATNHHDVDRTGPRHLTERLADNSLGPIAVDGAGQRLAGDRKAEPRVAIGLRRWVRIPAGD
jgi:hypothetical protein